MADSSEPATVETDSAQVADETPTTIEPEGDNGAENVEVNGNGDESKEEEEEEEKSEEKVENGNDTVEEENSNVIKLFVGRLPPGTKEKELRELFAQYGEVTHCDIVSKYGFVHMKSKEEADVAMEKLNNHEFKGSNITVQPSTSTARKTKRKPSRRKNSSLNNNGNGHVKMVNNNNKVNKQNNQKNRSQQSNHRQVNNRMGNNMNNRVGNNMNHNSNRNMRNNRHDRRFQRPMNSSMPSPMMNQGYYQPPMNQGYYPSPQPAPMQPVLGSPRDVYYNRPSDNGYYRNNGYVPQQQQSPVMYPNAATPQYAQSYQVYNRGGPPPMNKPMPPSPAPAQGPSMYPMQMNANPYGTLNSQPPSYGSTTYGQGSYGTMDNYGMGNNKYVGGYY